MGEPTLINGKTAVIKAVTLKQLFRLMALVDKVRSDLGISADQLKAIKLNKEGVKDFISKIVEVCVGTIDFDKEDTALTGTAALVCRELGALVGISADDVADATLDELTGVVDKFWEANAAGPFGAKVRSIIAKLAPTMILAKEVVMMGFQKELIRVLPNGGMNNGGATGYSSPLQTSSDGPNRTSPTTLPPEASLTGSEASATTPESVAHSTNVEMEVAELLASQEGRETLASLSS